VRRLRICAIEPSGRLYGSERSLLELLERLDRSRFDPDVVIPPGAPLAARLAASGIPSAGILRFGAPGDRRLRRLLSLLRLVLHLVYRRCDLVYLNQGRLLRPIARVASLLRLPVVCQCTTLYDVVRVGENPRSHRPVRAFVCVSDFIADRGSLPPERLSVIYRAYVPKGLRRPRRSVSSPDSFTVGLIGRICEQKGHGIVVRAARLLRERHPGVFRVRFVGEADDGVYLDSLRRLIRETGVTAMIEFRGFRRDIAPELAELDALVIASREEALGRVFLEAAEAGVPAVVADEGGPAELARRFSLGRRFPRDSPGELARALVEMRDDYDAERRRCEESAARMMLSLAPEPYLGAYEELFLKAAKRQDVAIRWTGVDTPA